MVKSTTLQIFLIASLLGNCSRIMAQGTHHDHESGALSDHHHPHDNGDSGLSSKQTNSCL